MDKNSSSSNTKSASSAIVGLEESSAFLRQWSKAIGAEGITSLATKTAGMVMDETQEAVAAAAAAVLPLSVQQRQTSQSSTTIPEITTASSSSSTSLPPNSLSNVNQDRSAIVKEGNRHLGETAASHLEQMAASLLESDAPLLWKDASQFDGIDETKEDSEMAKERIRQKWVHKLMSLATRCCATVDTNVKKGDMLDIRPYVKIKGKIFIDNNNVCQFVPAFRY